MLQCIEPLQTVFAYSNIFTRFQRNNFVLADHVLVWVLHVHAALPLQGTNMLFWPSFLVKMGEVAMFEFWLVAVVQTACPGWEVCWVTWGQAHLTSTQVMQRYPIISFKNDCFLRHLLGASSCLIFGTGMLAGPIVGDAFSTNEKVKPNWKYFKDPFWYHQLLAAGGAARAMVALQGPVSRVEVAKCQLCLCCTAHWVSHQAGLCCINIINWKSSFSCGLNYSNRVLELCRSH